jgi:hypothetical protein
MGPGRREPRAAAGGEPEQPCAGLALGGYGIGEGRSAAGADLDLGFDQLTGDGLGEHGVGLCRARELPVALSELERGRIEDLELLLESDGEVFGGLEDLARAGHVQHGQVR